MVLISWTHRWTFANGPSKTGVRNVPETRAIRPPAPPWTPRYTRPLPTESSRPRAAAAPAAERRRLNPAQVADHHPAEVQRDVKEAVHAVSHEQPVLERDFLLVPWPRIEARQHPVSDCSYSLSMVATPCSKPCAPFIAFRRDHGNMPVLACPYSLLPLELSASCGTMLPHEHDTTIPSDHPVCRRRPGGWRQRLVRRQRVFHDPGHRPANRPRRAPGRAADHQQHPALHRQ